LDIKVNTKPIININTKIVFAVFNKIAGGRILKDYVFEYAPTRQSFPQAVDDSVDNLFHRGCG